MRITLHHKSRLNCLWNGISPPSYRPDLVLLPLIDTWRDRSSFVLKRIASGHYNTNIVKPDFSKTARQNSILFSQSMENNFSIPLMLVRHRAALNYVLAQWMNIILQQETSQFLSQAAYMTWCFEVKFFIIVSSELRITLHHNSRLNCLWNGISPPSCRPDLESLALMAAWRVKTSFVPNWIACGHNTNIDKTDFSKRLVRISCYFPNQWRTIFHSTDASPPSCRPELRACSMNEYNTSTRSSQFLLQAPYITRVFWSKIFHNRLVTIRNNFAP